MGHEASGVIAEVGTQVRGYEPGDRVTFDSTVYCGECRFCRKGQINLCDNRRVLGVSCEEYRRHGAFAEYVSVPQRILYRLPEGVSFEEAALVEACSIAFHALRRIPVELGESAIVVGSGMIGLLIIQALRISGSSPIIAVDIDDWRLELARQLGAHATVNCSQEEVGPVVREVTEGVGVGLAYEVVGITSTLELALASVRKGGNLILVGNVSPEVNLPLQSVVTREVTLHGSCASQGEYPACLEMILRGAIDVKVLISQVAPLSEGSHWFKRLQDKEARLIKVVLRP